MTTIIKANGEHQAFSQEKLLQSIHRAGIPKSMQQEVLAHIESRLYENIPTAEIYRHITEFLEKSSMPFVRAKYSLKKSLMDLGPTGYPFEDYFAKLLTVEGFSTTVRNIVRGKCIMHEIDVIAQKDLEKIMVEAKYHNTLGIKTDVHVALYTQARFQDTKEQENFTSVLLVTNTKITTDVIAYAQCMHMQVFSWEYPEGNSLREKVEKYNLYPITALSKLPQTFKEQLLRQGVVLCKDICLNPAAIQSLSLSDADKNHILEEATYLCNK